MTGKEWLDEVVWDDQGLVPVVAQEAATGDVLMFAWMNREALERTVASGEAVYWSRRATQALAQGRGVRSRPEGARDAPRLRQRRAAAQGRADRRHRLPHRAPQLLLSQARRRPVGSGRSRAEGSCEIYKPAESKERPDDRSCSDSPCSAALAERKHADPESVTSPASMPRVPTRSARRSPRKRPRPSWRPRTAIACTWCGKSPTCGSTA